jgi:protease-4
MPFWESVRGAVSRAWVRWTFFLLLALGIGWLLAVLLIPTPCVGVIRFEDVIWADTIVPLEEQLRYAENDRSIRAIVIEVDSPGGEAAASERLHFDVLRLRERKPVVVMIGSMAASGGYYLASAADWIYATPSSDVGNIGVISQLPSPGYVDEEYLFTGPFKAFGSPRDSYMRQMEVLKDSFLECVFAQRGDRLKAAGVDRALLSRGELYVGTKGRQMGLVDGLGSREDAIAHAAKLAKIDHYSVVDVAAEMAASGVGPIPTPIPWDEVQARLSQPRWQQGYYFLYVGPRGGGER